MKNSGLKRILAFSMMFVMFIGCFDMPVKAEESISENEVIMSEEEEDILPDENFTEVDFDDTCMEEETEEETNEDVFEEIVPDAEEAIIIDEASKTGCEIQEVGSKKKEEPEPTVSSMSLISIPSKLIYRKGDDLDLTNGKIYVVYDDGTEAYLNMKAAMVSNYDKTKAGRQIVHINAGDKYVQFDVDVLNVDAGDDSKFVIGDQGFSTLTKALNWIKNNRDKTTDYEIIMFSNCLLRALPTVTKARSITITANTYYMEFYAVDKDKITFGCDTTLNDMTIKCLSAYEDKTKYRTRMKIKAKKNLTLNNCDFISSGLTISGRNKKSVVINKSTGIYKLKGFTNTTVNGDLEIKYSLDTKRLVMNPGSRVILSSLARLSVTKQLTCERDSQIVLGKDFKPLEITGNMGGTVKLVSDWPAKEGDLILNLKYSDILPYFDIDGIVPHDNCTYELVKEKDEARLYGHKFSYAGKSYTNWKSVIKAVNKDGNKETPVEIKLLGDVDIRDKLTMPKGKKMSSFTLNGNGHELIFRENIKLVKDTTFRNIKLKGLDDEDFVTRYYIYKRDHELQLDNADLGLGVVK